MTSPVGLVLASAATKLGLPLLLAVATGAVVYFLVGWVGAVRDYRTMSQLDKISAQIEEDERRKERLGPKARLAAALVARGYEGDLTPVFLVGGFAYLAVAVLLRFIHIGGALSFIVAAPVCVAGGVGVLSWMTTKRQRAFNHQLLQLLTLLAGQIESGVGPRNALDRVVQNLPNPIRKEMNSALASTKAQKSLVEAIRDLGTRYPSRALTMFISALEIDEAQGGRIEPALRQAAAILQRDFDLASEALAEISQVRSEFFAIVTIITSITVSMYTGGDQVQRQAYTSGIGIVVLTIAIANFGWGIFRSFKLFNRARGSL